VSPFPPLIAIVGVVGVLVLVEAVVPAHRRAPLEVFVCAVPLSFTSARTWSSYGHSIWQVVVVTAAALSVGILAGLLLRQRHLMPG
jgi:ABC-type nitrate/sulfonate/bicarbonate transport system permease component